jgi:RND family efflux transporter MFP subunit
MSLHRIAVFICLVVLLDPLHWAVEASAQMQVRVAPVLLAPIIEQLPLSGTVISPRQSNVAPQESGLVERIMVDEGDRVEAGDIMLELDAGLTRLQLRQLAARQEEARLLYQDAQRLANEGRRLVGERNISRSEYESRLAGEAASEQRLLQLAAEAEMQQLRLERHTLRAPFAGVVARKMTEIGQWLAAGSVAFNLAQQDPLRVQARVPERYFGEVGAGTPVRISFDARPGAPIEARVDSLVAVSDLNTRSFLARVDIPNAELRLAPGMSAQLLFELGDAQAQPALQVPADAIVRRADGSAVVWVVRGDTATALTVASGRRSRGWVEVITPELREGELVVTLGNESLREGQQVKAVRD